jgi:hypothetical protein
VGRGLTCGGGLQSGLWAPRDRVRARPSIPALVAMCCGRVSRGAGGASPQRALPAARPPVSYPRHACPAPRTRAVAAGGSVAGGDLGSFRRGTGWVAMRLLHPRLTDLGPLWAAGWGPGMGGATEGGAQGRTPGGTLRRVVARWGGWGGGLGAQCPASGQRRPIQGWSGGQGAWGVAARGGHPPPTGPRLGTQPHAGWAGAHSGGGRGPQLALPQGLERPGQAVPGPLGGAGGAGSLLLLSHVCFTLLLF